MFPCPVELAFGHVHIAHQLEAFSARHRSTRRVIGVPLRLQLQQLVVRLERVVVALELHQHRALLLEHARHQRRGQAVRAVRADHLVQLLLLRLEVATQPVHSSQLHADLAHLPPKCGHQRVLPRLLPAHALLQPVLLLCHRLVQAVHGARQRRLRLARQLRLKRALLRLLRAQVTQALRQRGAVHARPLALRFAQPRLHTRHRVTQPLARLPRGACLRQLGSAHERVALAAGHAQPEVAHLLQPVHAASRQEVLQRHLRLGRAALQQCLAKQHVHLPLEARHRLQRPAVQGQVVHGVLAVLASLRHTAQLSICLCQLVVGGGQQHGVGGGAARCGHLVHLGQGERLLAHAQCTPPVTRLGQPLRLPFPLPQLDQRRLCAQHGQLVHG
mmetsp:Transcript_4933/g.12090  ORF Transcript_4933/g.12090 Transcript_4933/m.12090 type:complete len:388 (-) Transcript_4933:113-1276(-)